MFCIMTNHSVDLLSWWVVLLRMKDGGKTSLICLVGTAALLLWNWGKAVVFLRSRDGGTCDELWLDFAEMWLHLRLVQLLQSLTTRGQFYWTLLCGVFQISDVIYCLWSPKISWHMFENPKQERHDAKFHDGLAIKDAKATWDTMVAQKECGKDWILILA